MNAEFASDGFPHASVSVEVIFECAHGAFDGTTPAKAQAIKLGRLKII
jgi:hypothetical protein